MLHEANDTSLPSLLEYFQRLQNPKARISLLIVSEDREFSASIVEVMSETGCNVFTAISAGNGLELYRKLKPRLVAVDIDTVPISFIEEMKFLSNEDVTVTALATQGNIDDLERYFNAGVGNFLWKPLNLVEFKCFIGHYLRQNHLIAERENVFRAMTNSRTDAFVIVDKYFNILLWNTEAERTFLFETAEVIGKNLLSLVISEKYHLTLSKYIGHITKNIDYLSNRNLYTMALDKRKREIFCKIKVMPLEVRGEVTAIITFRDASDMHARQELNMLKKSIDNIDIGFVIGDPQGLVIYANPYLNGLLRLGNAPIAGKKYVQDIFPALSELYASENLVRLAKYSTDLIIRFSESDELRVRLKCDTVVNESGAVSAVFIVCEGLSQQQKVTDDTLQLTELNQRLQDELARHNLIEERMDSTLKDLNMLLKEVHHRVKNNLQIISSLISLQSETIDDQSLLNIFNDTQTRIRAMALIHDKLYKSTDMSRLNFAEYINDLMAELYLTYEHRIHGIAMKVDIDPDLEICIDIAIPCGLIINELITNSIKYAFEGRNDGIIYVKFARHDDGKYVFDVGDNGIGCSHCPDFKTSKSLGLQLVNDLITRKLKGTIDIDSLNGIHYRMGFYGNDMNLGEG